MRKQPKVLARKNAVIITGPEFEDPEVIYPYYRLIEEGFHVDIATEGGVPVSGKHGFPLSALLKPSAPVDARKLKVSRYELVVVPGGFVAPDKVRQIREVLQFIEEMNAKGKIIASICHGPWVLISSGIMKGIQATCYPSMVDDLKNAGAVYLNEPAVVDGNIITARRPLDLPVWMEKTIETFHSQHHP